MARLTKIAAETQRSDGGFLSSPANEDPLDCDSSNTDSFQPVSMDTLEPINLDGFTPLEPVIFDPVTGELSGQAVEIHRLHAGIILALKDISASGAPQTVKLLENLYNQALSARDEALRFGQKAGEVASLESKRKANEAAAQAKKLKAFVPGNGPRIMPILAGVHRY